MSAAAEWESHGAEETQALGAELGAVAEPGDILLLLGPFGAGKTTLVRGIAGGLGVDGPVTSPSFVIANEYVGRIPLYHIDLYRVEQMDRATLEALADYFDGDGLCAVEWPDALPEVLVEGAGRLEIVVTGEESRLFRLTSPQDHLRNVFLRHAMVGP